MGPGYHDAKRRGDCYVSNENENYRCRHAPPGLQTAKRASIESRRLPPPGRYLLPTSHNRKMGANKFISAGCC